MNAWILSVVSVVAVSLVSLVGLLTLSLNERRLRRLAGVLVSFATGTLLADAFIHLIPESFARSPGTPLRASLLLLAGVLLFFVVEKLLRRRHGLLHHHHRHHPERSVPSPMAIVNLVGDAIHNFIDGVLIAASYLASPLLGLTTTMAVLFHELPQELGDCGILIRGGVRPRTAVVLNLASASAALLGALATLLAGAAAGAAATGALVPIAAGGFVYIAAADLIPELQHDRTLRALLTQTGLIAAGIAVMALLALLE